MNSTQDNISQIKESFYGGNDVCRDEIYEILRYVDKLEALLERSNLTEKKSGSDDDFIKYG